MNLQTEMKQEQAKKERKAAVIKSMENVLSKPSGTPERWRAAYEHFLMQRPQAKAEAEFVAKEVRERRKSMDEFASTKNGRMAYSTPEYLLDLLKSLDHEYFATRTAIDFAGAKHLNLMKKAFPEFFYAEVI